MNSLSNRTRSFLRSTGRAAVAVVTIAAPVVAQAAADASATGVFDVADDTYTYAKPIGLGIMGTFLAVGIVRLVWKRFAR